VVTRAPVEAVVRTTPAAPVTVPAGTAAVLLAERVRKGVPVTVPFTAPVVAAERVTYGVPVTVPVTAPVVAADRVT